MARTITLALLIAACQGGDAAPDAAVGRWGEVTQALPISPRAIRCAASC